MSFLGAKRWIRPFRPSFLVSLFVDSSGPFSNACVTSFDALRVAWAMSTWSTVVTGTFVKLVLGTS